MRRFSFVNGSAERHSDAPRPVNQPASSEAELLEFLFLPGFSTRDAVSEMSGRGVPFFTATAVAERARSARVPRTTLPLAVNSSMPSAVTMVTSLISPSVACLISRADGPKGS